MKVQTIVRRLYRKFEESLWSLSTDLILLFERTVSDIQVKRKVTEVKSDLDTLHKAILSVRKCELTLKVAAADSVRYNAYSALIKRIGSDLTRVQRPQLQQNAEHLNTLIRQIDRKLSATKPDLSIKLFNLFEQFNKPVHFAMIKDNGMRTIYDDLKIAQSKFQTLWSARTKEPTWQEQIPELRIAADTLVSSLEDKLFKRIEILAQDFGEPYISLISALNQIIDTADQLQRSRITRPFNELENDLMLAQIMVSEPATSLIR